MEEYTDDIDEFEGFVSYAAPTFVYREAVAPCDTGRVLFRNFLMRALRDGAHEILIEPRSRYGLAHVVVKVKDETQEILAPKFDALFEHLQTICGVVTNLNLHDVVEEFLSEAYASNQLGNDYIDSLRSTEPKKFEMSIELDREERTARVKLKPVP